jgi:hypothetical protein
MLYRLATRGALDLRQWQAGDDAGGAAPTDPPAGDDPSGTPPPPPPAGKTFTQAELDRQIERRLERDRRERVPALEQEIRDKLERERVEADLKDQQQFKPLYEQAQARVAELTPALTRAETAEAERDRYKQALEDGLKKRLEGLPAPIVELLAAKDPIEQAAWLDANAEALGAPTHKGPPGIPRGDNVRDLTDADRTAAQERERAQTRAAF